MAEGMKEVMGELTLQFLSGTCTAEQGWWEKRSDSTDWGRGRISTLVKTRRASLKLFDDSFSLFAI